VGSAHFRSKNKLKKITILTLRCYKKYCPYS